MAELCQRSRQHSLCRRLGRRRRFFPPLGRRLDRNLTCAWMDVVSFLRYIYIYSKSIDVTSLCSSFPLEKGMISDLVLSMVLQFLMYYGGTVTCCDIQDWCKITLGDVMYKVDARCTVYACASRIKKGRSFKSFRDQQCRSCTRQLKTLRRDHSMLQMMIWMSYLDSSHFSDQFRYFIYQIPIYRFVNMDYSISNGKRK
jgi:hypothetical protein